MHTGSGMADVMTALLQVVRQMADLQAQNMSSQTASSAAMSEALSEAESQHTRLLETLTEASRESASKTRGDKPQLKAASAESFRLELKQLKTWFNDAKVSDRRVWFKTSCSCVEGTPTTEL